MLLDPFVLLLKVFLEVMLDGVWTGLCVLEDIFALPGYLRQSVFAEEHVKVRVVVLIPATSVVGVDI